MPALPPVLSISVSSLMVPVFIATSASNWVADAPADGAALSVPGLGAACEGVGLVSVVSVPKGVVRPRGR
eukprot:4822948-Heterocapsa_arctica.AAC.1